MRNCLRKTNNAVIAGVCGGIAEYFEADPTFVRVIFAIGAINYGILCVIYLILAFIMPDSQTVD